MELSAQTVKRLAKELTDLQQTPINGCRVVMNERDLADIQVEMEGPAGTPYEGGMFRLRLTLQTDFPASPPKGFFLTKIFHPNVNYAQGDICVNTLKKDWTPATSIRHVLMVIRCLLIQPFPDSALNEEAGRLILEDFAQFEKHARLMTSIHAQPKRIMPLTASGANAGVSGQQEGSKPGTESASGSPQTKKAKPEVPAKASATAAAKAVKKSLKRL